MDYYIKIKPKLNISTFSKYSFDKLTSLQIEKIERIERITTSPTTNKPYPHGGYVRCFYGENDIRFIVYENVPHFGHIKGKFKTMREAMELLEELTK